MGLTASAGEGRRLIDQGGVRVDGETLDAGVYNVARESVESRVLQVGKRRFARPIQRG